MTLRLSDRLLDAVNAKTRRIIESTAFLRGEERRRELVRKAMEARATAESRVEIAFWEGLVRRFETEDRWGR